MKPGSLLIPVCLLLLAVIGCGKSNNNTKPVLKLKSINSTVNVGENMVANLTFENPGASLSEGTFVAIRNRLNKIPIPPTAKKPDTITGPIPQFPDEAKGDFQFVLSYNDVHESDVENDTIIFKFAAIDRNGKKSDTLTTPKIVVKHP